MYKLNDFTDINKPGFAAELDEQIRLFADVLYNRREVYVNQHITASDGSTNSLFPPWFSKRLVVQQPSTNIAMIGIGGTTIVRASSGTPVTSETDFSDDMFVMARTSTTVGNAASLISVSAFPSRASAYLENANPYLYAKIQLTNTSGLRYFLAISTNNLTDADDPQPGVSAGMVGFRYIPSISNQFYIMAKTYNSATTFYPTGIGVVANQNYHLEVKIQNFSSGTSHAFFYIDNVRVGRLLSTAFSFGIGGAAGVSSVVFYNSGTAKQMAVARMIWSQDPIAIGYPFSPSAYIGTDLA